MRRLTYDNNQKIPMKKIIVTTAALIMCGSAFAQNSTGPAPQSNNMDKPGMEKNSMEKGSMTKDTTGMNKDGMKGSMMKPDASGQGGAGLGRYQGGTKSNVK